MMWIITALLSAVFSGASSLLAKKGVKKTDPLAETTILTAVILLLSWLAAFLTGELSSLPQILSLNRLSLIFMGLSGAATSLCWIYYYKALSIGAVHNVMAIEKSNIAVTILIAIFFFQETDYLWEKLLGVVILCLGLYFLIQKGKSLQASESKTFYRWAFLSAAFAALNTVFSKMALSGLPSNLGTAINMLVALVVTILWVFMNRRQAAFHNLPKNELPYIIAAGVANSACWLCYYHAVKYGILSVVIPLNKMSIPFTALWSYLVYKENIPGKKALGLTLITAGMIDIAIWI